MSAHIRLHHRHPPAGPRGQDAVDQLPLRHPPRLLRADLHRHGGHAAVARHPRPGGGRLRARLLQPDHRPLRRAGQGRPRLGAGVVPRLRLAELRPHRGGPAGQPVAGLGAGHQRRPRAGPAPVGPHRRRRWRWWRRSSSSGGVACAGRRPGPTRSPPTSSGAGPALGCRRRIDETLSAYGQRLAGGRPAATGRQLIGVTPVVERYTYGGIEPSAEQIAAALAFTRRFRSGVAGAGGPAGRASRPRQRPSASSNEAPAASSGR